jgi:Tol biopolymer transport system component
MSFAHGRRRGTQAALVWVAAVSSPSLLSSQRAEPPIIPRAVLFGNPERVAPQVSPDGRKLAYVAPDSGVLNVWVRTIGKRDDRPVTRDRTRPILQYHWQGDSKHVLHLQDRGGDENWRLFQTDVATLFAEYLGGRVEPAATEEKVEAFVQ